MPLMRSPVGSLPEQAQGKPTSSHAALWQVQSGHASRQVALRCVVWNTRSCLVISKLLSACTVQYHTVIISLGRPFVMNSQSLNHSKNPHFYVQSGRSAGVGGCSFQYPKNPTARLSSARLRPIYILTWYLFNSHFNIIIYLSLRPAKWSLL